MITPTERDELELQEAVCMKLIRQPAGLNHDAGVRETSGFTNIEPSDRRGSGRAKLPLSVCGGAKQQPVI